MKKIISIMLIAVLITIGNLNDVKGEEKKSEKYIFNDNCLEQVIINNNVVVKNKYNESGYRIWKQGEEISSFIYNEKNLLVKEIRNEKIIEYLYEYNYNYKFYMVSGFIYDGDKYLYERDEKNRISGIVDNDNEEIAKYEYMDNTDFVLNVLKYVNCSWEECEDKQFIGNINKIRNICAYLDDETELYYENGVFFDALTNKVIKENNNISLLEYSDDLDYSIYCWQQQLLDDEWFNSSAPYTSDWYQNLSDVEILARVIYGENTSVTRDQDAIAWVIRNRAVEYGTSPRDVVLEQYQFSAAGVPNEPSYNTVKAQNSGEVGWANAVYMACLLCTTLDEYDWNIINAKPSGMSYQKYYRAWFCYDNFSYDGTMYYDGNAVKDVFIVGYGSVDSYDELCDIIYSYNDRNIFFSYY